MVTKSYLTGQSSGFPNRRNYQGFLGTSSYSSNTQVSVIPIYNTLWMLLPVTSWYVRGHIVWRSPLVCVLVASCNVQLLAFCSRGFPSLWSRGFCVSWPIVQESFLCPRQLDLLGWKGE